MLRVLIILALLPTVALSKISVADEPGLTLTPDQALSFLGPDQSFCERFLSAWSSFF